MRSLRCDAIEFAFWVDRANKDRSDHILVSRPRIVASELVRLALANHERLVQSYTKMCIVQLGRHDTPPHLANVDMFFRMRASRLFIASGILQVPVSMFASLDCEPPLHRDKSFREVRLS